jgi:hypothetical protein
MVLTSAVHVSDEERLRILRRLDQFRHWHSLDDKRYCLVCGKIITGRQIQVLGGARGNGPLRLVCPTQRCHSIPMDWVLPTAEILADITKQESARTITSAGRRNGDTPKKFPIAAAPDKTAISSGLRKLATWLKRPI